MGLINLRYVDFIIIHVGGKGYKCYYSIETIQYCNYKFRKWYKEWQEIKQAAKSSYTYSHQF